MSESYQELQRTVDDLTFKVEDALRWAQSLINVAQSGELGNLALVNNLSSAPVGNLNTLRNNMQLDQRYMRPGDFGIGEDFAGPIYPVSDFENSPGGVPVGEYRFTANDNANPPFGFPAGTLSVRRFSSERVVLIAIRDLDMRMAWRAYGSSGPVGPWREMYHQGRVVGSVSQASGVPTGALFENVSNANGRYVRLADGTMMATRTVVPNITVTNSETFDYPVTGWIGAPTAGGAPSNRPLACGWSVANDIGGSGAAFNSAYVNTRPGGWRWSNSETGANNQPIDLFAFGRWY